MRYVPLGRSGVKVSPLCLGTMMFGGQADEPTARTIIGPPATPASTSSTPPTSTTRAAPRRSPAARSPTSAPRWVVATKVGNPMGAGPNDRGLSRRWIALACEASLRRLGTGWVDVLLPAQGGPLDAAGGDRRAPSAT